MDEKSCSSENLDEGGMAAAVESSNTIMEHQVVMDPRLFKNRDNGKLHRGKAGWLMTTACGISVTEKYSKMAAGAFDPDEVLNLCDSCFKTEAGRQLKRALCEPMASER